MKKVLIIDDEESMRHMLSVILKREGYEPTAISDAKVALELIGDEEFDFLLSDIRMPGMSGMELLTALEGVEAAPTVIMMSAYGTIDLAVECMVRGAYDYISKPFQGDEIVLTLKKAEERERLKRENTRLKREVSDSLGEIVTRDPEMLDILNLAGKVSKVDSTVLITGESGTGKELVARAIHSGGPRAGGPFVGVNCGAIPGELLESELFGHVKGAFTGAHRGRVGLFEEASGGTLLLDEVGELPPELQVKLLRVLQEGEVRRVGDEKTFKVDTRVIGATVRDLGEAIKGGDFREDLYYRLNVVRIDLPPLRNRPLDVEDLANHFLSVYSETFGREGLLISPEAMELLKGYPWPGNVRELENIMERCVLLLEGTTLRPEDLPSQFAPSSSSSSKKGPGSDKAPGSDKGGGGKDSQLGAILPEGDLSIKHLHEAGERYLIERALKETGGNRTRAAELLEISHRSLLYKIKDYKIEG